MICQMVLPEAKPVARQIDPPALAEPFCCDRGVRGGAEGGIAAIVCDTLGRPRWGPISLGPH